MEATQNSKLCNPNRIHDELESKKVLDNTNPNIIGDTMWPIIFFLKAFGHSPLSYDFPSESSQKGMTPPVRQYKVRFCSSFLVWSAFCALWIMLGWVNYASVFLFIITGRLEIGNQKQEKSLFGNNSSEIVHEAVATTATSFDPNIMLAIQIIFSGIHGWEIVFSWAESASLARFLNEADRIEANIKLVFPFCQRFMTIRKTRNVFVLFYVVIPTVIAVPYFVLVLETFIRLIFVVPITMHMFAVSLMEDVKVFMTYRILAESFGEIREGILYSLKWEKLTVEKVRIWRKLVHSVRLQVELAGDSQKSHQLLLIGGTIALITSAGYSSLRIASENVNSAFITAASAYFAIFLIGRLYLKILCGNRITYKESLIASDFLAVDTTNSDDQSLQLEIKFFHDMITQNPSVICFDSYVTLNKRLLLGVGSQVATYLIVLMQLKN